MNEKVRHVLKPLSIRNKVYLSTLHSKSKSVHHRFRSRNQQFFPEKKNGNSRIESSNLQNIRNVLIGRRKWLAVENWPNVLCVFHFPQFLFVGILQYPLRRGALPNGRHRSKSFRFDTSYRNVPIDCKLLFASLSNGQCPRIFWQNTTNFWPV